MKSLNISFQLLIGLFFILICPTNSNLWDNIFGNFKSPNLIFPKNWQTAITYQNDLITFNIHLYYSSNYGSFKATVLVDLFNTKTLINASEILLSLKEDQLYYHTPTTDCEIYRTPQLLQGSFNNSDMANIWKIIAFYNGETPSGFKKFDISGLFSMINSEPSSTIYTYFNKKSQLNFIEMNSNGKTFLFDVIEKLKDVEFSEEFFSVPSEWKCENKTIQNLTDLNTFGLENVLKELMTESISKENIDVGDDNLLADPKTNRRLSKHH